MLTAQFTPDGKKVLTVSSDGSMKIWEARSFPAPAPDWLAPLAEAVGGQRLDDHGMTVTVAFGEIVEWKKKIMARPGHDSYAAWAQWFFADRGRRKTAPFSEIPVSDYIDSLVQENTFASLQEALWLSPTNGLALARYAKALANEGTNTTAAEVDFLTRCALQFAPGSAEVVAIRENLGGTNILTNPALAGLSLRGSSDSKPGANVINKAAVSLKPILLNPSEIPFRLPPRNPTAAPALIDLSAFYNADPATGWTDGDPKNALGTIPRGVQAFGNIQFDVRGIVQLCCAKSVSQPFPKEVTGIRLGQRCKKVHFLHAACMSFGTTNGTEIGRFLFHAAGLAAMGMPIRFGFDVRDWQAHPKQQPVGPDPATIVWTGKHEAGRGLQLFKSTWENPNPEAILENLDYVSAMSTAAPFLIAVTVEP